MCVATWDRQCCHVVVIKNRWGESSLPPSNGGPPFILVKATDFDESFDNTIVLTLLKNELMMMPMCCSMCGHVHASLVWIDGCRTCLANMCHRPIMLHSADKLDTKFLKYPNLWDALAASLITAATLARIEGGSPLWPWHISKDHGGATTLYTHELALVMILYAKLFVCEILSWFDSYVAININKWETHKLRIEKSFFYKEIIGT